MAYLQDPIPGMLPSPIAPESSYVNSCGQEWRTYGVCCNVYHLPTHLGEAERNLKTALDQVTKLFVSLDSPVTKIFDILKRTAWVPFIKAYHEFQPFRGLRPALIPAYTRFNPQHNVP